MFQFSTFDSSNVPAPELEQALAAFLFKHLDAYGDPQEDIQKAIDYALGRNGAPGGLILASVNASEITGAVVLNKTGMSRYIPENILVYIATHSSQRGKGLGRALMNEAIAKASGSIALHVEADNPAKRLYESLGFSNKYLEMRLQR